MKLSPYRHLFTALLCLVLSAFALTSCKPEPEPDPNTPTLPEEIAPTEANYVVCGNDSLNIDIVVVMRSSYKSDVMDWSIKLSDSQILKLYTMKDLQVNGTHLFTDESTAYNSNRDVYGVYMEGFDEENIAEGTIEVKVILGKPEIVIRATTQSGREVRMHFWGDLHDLTHPIGNGHISYNDVSLPLQIAYSQIYYDLYEYAFSDTISGFGVTFYSVTPLTTGTYAISDDMDAVGAGEALNLYLQIENGGTLLEGDVTNGTATCTFNGDQLNITFSGELGGTAISGSYVGKMENLSSSIL